jgi:hypothetical protein
VGTRSDALASQFEQAVAEFARTVESCSADQWRAVCGSENWTVAATAQHVAGQFPVEREFIHEAATGGKGLTYTWADINASNDGRAADNTACSKEDVLKLLRESGASMAAFVRGLSDDQLDRTAPLALADGASVAAQQLIEGGVLIDHVKGHLQSIRSAM